MYHRVGANVYLLLYYFHARLAAVAASKRIFLMSTPWHGNLGDQAIILAEYQVLKRAFPDYTIIEYPTEVIRKLLMRFDWKPAMHGDDIIAMHGGLPIESHQQFSDNLRRILDDCIIRKCPLQHLILS